MLTLFIKVADLSYAYGERHVDWKAYGFKPDFWVSLSEMLTKEVINLDQAIHNQTDVIEGGLSDKILKIGNSFNNLRFHLAIGVKRASILDTAHAELLPLRDVHVGDRVVDAALFFRN